MAGWMPGVCCEKDDTSAGFEVEVDPRCSMGIWKITHRCRSCPASSDPLFSREGNRV